MALLPNTAEFPRIVAKFTLPATTPMTLKTFIETSLAAATQLFINAVAANQAARLALTGIASGYLVYQTDTTTFWKFTGADPAVAGDWTRVAQSVADQTARLAISSPPLGTIVFQVDNGKWYNYIGVPDNHLADDPVNNNQWLEVPQQPSYAKYLYSFLNNLTWKLDRDTRITNANGSAVTLLLLSSFVVNADGTCPYTGAIITTYGVSVLQTASKTYVGVLDPALLNLYCASACIIELELTFVR